MDLIAGVYRRAHQVDRRCRSRVTSTLHSGKLPGMMLTCTGPGAPQAVKSVDITSHPHHKKINKHCAPAKFPEQLACPALSLSLAMPTDLIRMGYP